MLLDIATNSKIKITSNYYVNHMLIYLIVIKY